MSQLSEGGLSDIISDVDSFIDDNHMRHLLDNVMTDGVNSPLNESDFKLPGEDMKLFNGLDFDPSHPPQNFQHANKFPPSEPANLCNDEYPGPLNFEVYIVPNDQRTPWEYSATLNKIFIGMGLKFPVAFSVKSRPEHMNLFVRATPAFSQSQFFQELVHRCIGHEHPQDPSNKDLPEHVFQHIIRCNSIDAQYFGDKNNGKRLSIVVPLSSPQAGTDTVKEFFYFVCKNSCPSGMNRRPIEVIFSLEDETGRVLGRRVVCVRICSCPKRDKEKEEKEVDKSNNPAPHGKKRKLENDKRSKSSDTKPIPLSFNIVGKNNYRRVLEFSQSLMALEIVELEGKNGADAPYRKCLKEINSLLGKTE